MGAEAGGWGTGAGAMAARGPAGSRGTGDGVTAVAGGTAVTACQPE
jgi:hypothetical protein